MAVKYFSLGDIIDELMKAVKAPEDEVAWACYRVDGDMKPAIPWAKKGKCTTCGEKIWYDPYLVKSHPQLKLAKRYCLFCLATKAVKITSDGKEVRFRYPHRES